MGTRSILLKSSMLITLLLTAGYRAAGDESAPGAFLPPAPEIGFHQLPDIAPVPGAQPSGGSGSRGGSSGYFGLDDLVRYDSNPEGNQSLAIDSTGRMYLAIEKTVAGQHIIDVYKSEGFNESWTHFFGTTTGDSMEPCLAVGEGAADKLLMVFIYDDGVDVALQVATSPLDYSNPKAFSLPIWNWEGYANPVIWTDSVKFNAWYAFVACEGIFDSATDNINVCAWRSTDYGKTWDHETVVFGNSDPDAWRDPDGCFGTSSSDDFLVCYNDTSNTLVEAISEDDGATWSSKVDVFTMSTEPDHAVDPEIAAAMDNANVMICCTKYDTKMDSDCIGYTTSEDFGAHWTSLFKVPGSSSIDEYAVALTANEGGGNWHIAFNQGSNVLHTSRPQDLSTTWTSPPAVVTDSATASGASPFKGIATHWAYDICGVAWTDFRGSSSDVDIYFDYSVNTQQVWVPTGFPTIQKAIDSVWHDTVVWVEPGIYIENLDLKGKVVHLIGVEGPDYTYIDGTGSGSVITLDGLNDKVVIESLTIRYGKAAQGGAINIHECVGVIRNCVIHTNKADDGGGIFLDHGYAMIVNCTFLANKANSKGGAVYCMNDSSPTIKNSILWGNQAPTGSAIYIESGAPEVMYCNVEGGYSGTGNIDADPLFVDEVTKDCHLLYNSPCRDAGTTDGLYHPLRDFEGDPREVGAAPDMGADEFHRHFYVRGDLTPGGDIVGRLVGEPGTVPVYIWFGSGVIDPPISTHWGDWYLLPPFIETGYLPAIPADGVMDLSTTLPMSYPAPYDVPMQAAVGMFTNLCTLRVR